MFGCFPHKMLISYSFSAFQNCYEMEKYLRYEPRLSKPSCTKRSRLSASKNMIMAGCKSPSVDDILAFKNDDIMMCYGNPLDYGSPMGDPDDVDSEGEDRLSLDDLNLFDENLFRTKQQRRYLMVGKVNKNSSNGLVTPTIRHHEDRISLSSSSSSMLSLTSVLEPVQPPSHIDPNGNTLPSSTNGMPPHLLTQQLTSPGSKLNQNKQLKFPVQTLTPPSSPESIPSNLVTRNGSLVRLQPHQPQLQPRTATTLPRLISLSTPASIAALKSALPLPRTSSNLNSSSNLSSNLSSNSSHTNNNVPIMAKAKSMLRLDVSPVASPAQSVVNSAVATAANSAVATAASALPGVDDDNKRRIHKCTFPNCQKVYTKSSHLKAHQRTHTGKISILSLWVSILSASLEHVNTSSIPCSNIYMKH